MKKNNSQRNFDFDEDFLPECELKTNKKGIPYLRVFYDPDLDNFDEAIKKARADHGVDSSKIMVIAKPQKRSLT